MMVPFLVAVLAIPVFLWMLWQLVVHKKKPDRYIIFWLILFEIVYLAKQAAEYWPFN